MTNPLLVLLTGPTAVGKTDLAIAWAEQLDAEIVSCDSLLFYRGLDIGTAKPDADQRARVPHHFIDVREVHDPWDVAGFASAAAACVRGIAARGRVPLVVGGSGFYLKAFLAPVADGVPVPPAIREQVRRIERTDGLPGLLDALRAVQRTALPASLDVRNPRRVARALERCLASGLGLQELAEAFAAQPPPFAGWNVHVARLTRGRAVLDARIDTRTAAMLEAGLVAETVRARAAGLERNAPAAASVGYRECLDHLDGRLAAGALHGAIAARTRALVRKQDTWFRHQLPPHAAIDLDVVPHPAAPRPD